ncbi:MAG: DUF4142 domain-containing protein [Pseudomonadota bacterium]
MNLPSSFISFFSGKPSRKSRLLTAVAGAVLACVLAAIPHADAALMEVNDQLSGVDKQFLMTAAQTGNTEIVASKTASGKASSEDVKTFAAEVLADHSKVADQLKKLASSKGVNVPDEPSMKQQAVIARLNVLDAKKFDREFTAEIGVSAHKEAVALFRKAVMNAKDADVKAFAQQSLPALEHHLQMAQDLKAKLDRQ